MNRGFKEFLIYFFSKVFSGGIKYVLTILLGVYLSVSDFGKVGMISMIIPFVSYMIGWGFSGSYSIKYYKIKAKERANLVSTIFIFTFIMLIVILLFMMVFGKKIENKIDLGIDNRLYIEIIMSGYMAFISDFFPNIYKLDRKARKFGIFQLISAIVYVLFTIILIYIEKNKLAAYIDGMFYSSLVTTIYLIYDYIKYNKKYKFKMDIRLFKAVFALSIPVVIGFVFTYLLNYADRYILNQISKSYVTTGIYYMGYRLGEMFNLFIVTPFIVTINPILYKQFSLNKIEFKKMINKYIYYFNIIFIIYYFILCALVNIFINKFMPVQYSNSIVTARIVSISYFMFGLSQIMSIIILVNEKITYVTIINVFSACFNIVLNYLLIPKYGIIGASLSTLFAYFIILILYYLYAKMNMKIIIRFNINGIITVYLIMLIVSYKVSFSNMYIDSLKYVLMLAIFIVYLIKRDKTIKKKLLDAVVSLKKNDVRSNIYDKN